MSKVYVGEYEVLHSGITIVPANENVVRICISNLEFVFEFMADKKAKENVLVEAVNNTLKFKLYNYFELAGQGVVGDDFTHVATLDNRKVGVAFMCYTNVNTSRMFYYTFAYLDSGR